MADAPHRQHRVVPIVVASPERVVESAVTGWCGAVVGWDKGVTEWAVALVDGLGS